jgi:hypothetical protein
VYWCPLYRTFGRGAAGALLISFLTVGESVSAVQKIVASGKEMGARGGGKHCVLVVGLVRR